MQLILFYVFVCLCAIILFFLNARGAFLTTHIKDKESYQHKCATCEQKKKDRDAILQGLMYKNID